MSLEPAMAMLTIRDLDDALKQRLRLRAAGNARSMEEEARQILRSALTATSTPGAGPDLATRIRQRFAGLGDIALPIAPREPMREPPDLADTPAAPRAKPGKGRRP
jgi:antitoxin FitA